MKTLRRTSTTTPVMKTSSLPHHPHPPSARLCFVQLPICLCRSNLNIIDVFAYHSSPFPVMWSWRNYGDDDVDDDGCWQQRLCVVFTSWWPFQSTKKIATFMSFLHWVVFFSVLWPVFLYLYACGRIEIFHLGYDENLKAKGFHAHTTRGFTNVYPMRTWDPFFDGWKRENKA